MANLPKPKFFQAVLVPIEDVIKHVYPPTIADQITLEERLPDNAKCPECSNNEWWILPNDSVAVREGGKAYCECMNCGYQTHL